MFTNNMNNNKQTASKQENKLYNERNALNYEKKEAATYCSVERNT